MARPQDLMGKSGAGGPLGASKTSLGLNLDPNAGANKQGGKDSKKARARDGKSTGHVSPNGPSGGSAGGGGKVTSVRPKV